MLKKTRLRTRRKTRGRYRIAQNSKLPRLSVHKSGLHVYAQIVDVKDGGKVLASYSSCDMHVEERKDKKRTDIAIAIGHKIADIAIERGVKEVVFDTSGYKYHGVVKSLADAVREQGLRM